MAWLVRMAARFLYFYRRTRQSTLYLHPYPHVRAWVLCVARANCFVKKRHNQGLVLVFWRLLALLDAALSPSAERYNGLFVMSIL
jgi:hypothetical protein